MALHMQELRAGRTGRVVFRTQVDNNEGDNARLDEGVRVVTRAVVTQAEVCETKEDKITAPEASGRCVRQEEGTITVVRESTLTSPVQKPPTGSQKKAALYFVYSVVLTIVNVYAALATESFSWSCDSSVWDKNVVFGISAALEASGLAFGVGMSIRHYLDANGGIEWSDTLSMPHIISLEGMLGEGEKGRTLFLVGLEGSVCEGIIGAIVFPALTMRDEVGVLAVSCVALVIVLCLGELAMIRTSKDNVKTLMLFLFGCHFIVISLGLKVLKAYYLIVSGFSAVTCTLTVLDAVAIVPLVTVTIGVNVGWQLYQLSHAIGLVPLWYFPASCVATIQAIDPDAFLSFGVTSLVKINVLGPRKPCFTKPKYVAMPGDETAGVSSMP